MLISEARWLGERLRSLPHDDLFPLLNVGSSTQDFRERVQPHIHAHVFGPLEARGGRVWHVDLKDAPGVDLVGDLLDLSFLARLRGLRIRSVLVSNLFEHITDRELIAAALLQIVAPGGYIIVSGPRAYPHHADPIDTMFRPTPDEMARHFPGAEVTDAAILDAGNWRRWVAAERGGRSLVRVLIRLCTPLYRPSQWLALARQAPFLVKHSTAFAVVLRRL